MQRTTKQIKQEIKQLDKELTSLKVKRIKNEFEIKKWNKRIKTAETIIKINFFVFLVSFIVYLSSLFPSIELKQFTTFEDGSGRIVVTYCLNDYLCD